MEGELSRSGGLYLPPHKIARLIEATKLEGSDNNENHEQIQRLSWEKLRKTINGCVNKVNSSNLANVVEDLFQANLIRGRGLLTRAILKSQTTAPQYTAVFAAVVAVANSRIPDIGLLLIQRLILQLRRAQKRQDKSLVITSLKFCAHLINQRVLSDVAALELCGFFLDGDDKTESAIFPGTQELSRSDCILFCCSFLAEVGAYLEEELSKGLAMISNRLHEILSEGEVEERIQYEIENFFKLRRSHFEGYPIIPPELDLLEASDRITHDVDVFAPPEAFDRQEMLDIFQFQEPSQYKFEQDKWRELSREILGDDEPEAADDDIDDALEALDQEDANVTKIIDRTEQDNLNLRKTIYLCIMSSLNFEESVHKLLKMNMKPGDEREIVNMLIDCCSIDRTFNRSLAMQGERLCFIDQKYRDGFSEAFYNHYQTVHRFETNNLRNIAKFFGHLLSTGAIPIDVIKCMKLTEDDTTAASRIFIKVLLQDLVDSLGMKGVDKLIRNNQAIFDNTLLLREDKTVARFCVNFFTAIGLADLAAELRGTLTA